VGGYAAHSPPLTTILWAVIPTEGRNLYQIRSRNSPDPFHLVFTKIKKNSSHCYRFLPSVEMTVFIKEKESGRLRRPLSFHYHLAGSHSDRREESLANPTRKEESLANPTRKEESLANPTRREESLANPTRREESLAKPTAGRNLL